ncbi:MAG: gamma-glutamyl-gamma-aminobutyrate hydrolase family protein [Candidatus Peribacteria bacterium]|nr:MAG: gamma-glutamyl-gamma-aminobutyrate hydrolase family protein [Candidatus Peribacteria bacterium]
MSDIHIIQQDSIFAGIETSNFQVSEAHRWKFADLDGFAILAISGDGIEIAKKTDRLMYGVQFHPEILHTHVL